MNEVRYEINWHSSGDVFSHCTVTPITVIREGVLPGCSGVSITAISSDGHKFQGSPGNYFNTESEAWESVKEDLVEAVRDYESQIKAQQKHLRAMIKFWEELK